MIDDLDQIHRANPATPADLQAAVAVDRAELLALLEADGRSRAATAALGAKRSRSRSRSRVGYGAAVAAAAAAVVVALSIGVGQAPDTESSPVGAADQSPGIDPDLAPAQDPAAGTGDGEGEGESRLGVPTSAIVDPPDEAATPEDEAGRSGGGGGSADDGHAGTDDDDTTTASTARMAGTGQAERAVVTEVSPFDPDIDLVSIHFDFAHHDDGHATAATRGLVARFDLDAHVVVGTASPATSHQTRPYEAVSRAAWGDRWLDAEADRAAAVAATTQRWLAVIDTGGRVWVAEGGVSDFTAEVLAEIAKRRPALATEAAIRVVQHNTRNERASADGTLDAVAATTTYIRIDDGNEVNDTADLNQPSASFEAAALAGPDAEVWAVAFEALAPAKLDFSDTVELLHILGVDLSEVASPDDFAAAFLS